MAFCAFFLYTYFLRQTEKPSSQKGPALMRARFLPRFDPDSLDNRNPFLIQLLIPRLGWALKKYFRARVTGVERIPSGAALYVGNHNMGMQTLDTGIFFASALAAWGIDAVPYGLQHDAGVVIPGLRRLAGWAGGIRASRDNALKILAAGHKVLTYPGGDLDTYRPFRHRDKIVFGGRTGYIRLALCAQVPIVPVVTAGAQAVFYVVDDMRSLARLLRADKLLRARVWPLMISFPLGVTLFPNPFFIPWPSRILMEVMEPMYFDPTGPQAAREPDYVAACARAVEAAMQETLTRLARQRLEKPEKGVRG